MPRPTCRLFPAAALACLLPGCLPAQVPPARRPDMVRQRAEFLDERLTESSGVAVSRRQPGVLWTHNDSGNAPWLFAVDTGGRTLAVFTVPDATNRDWEDIAIGPCGEGQCLYLGDTGDNAEHYPDVTLYRLAEPDVGHTGLPSREPAPRSGPKAERLAVRYPDHPHDVEALYVAPNGDTQLITKGRDGHVLQFSVPATAWAAGSAVARLVDTLPLSIEATMDYVTGAALSPDGRRVALRTYRDVRLLAVGPGGRLRFPPLADCSVFGLEGQGEGVDWLTARLLVLTSERALLTPGLVSVVACPDQ